MYAHALHGMWIALDMVILEIICFCFAKTISICKLAILKIKLIRQCFLYLHLLWTRNDLLVIGETKNLHTLLIYICTSTFGLFLFWDAYIVGVMIPATAIVLISMIALGILLFEVKVIYSILPLAILIIITIAHPTLNG